MPEGAHAFCNVAVDGRVIASSGRIVAGPAPRQMDADLGLGHVLELRVSTDTFACVPRWARAGRSR